MAASNSIPELEARKKQLEQEIVALRSGLEHSIEDVKETVQNNVREYSRPETWVKKYPLATVGVSLVAGLLIGRAISGKARKAVRAVSKQVTGSGGVSGIEPKPARPSKGASLMQFLKPFAGRMWDQFGPAVLAYGEQMLAQKAAQAMQQHAEEAGAKASKSL